MSENLINVLKGAFNNTALDVLSRKIGEDTARTQSGINAIIPTVLAGLLGKNLTAQPTWWGSIVDFFTDDDDEDDLRVRLLDDDKFTNNNAGILNSLFGNNVDQVSNAVANASGLVKSKAANLLSMVAPLAIGYLQRWLRRKNWTFTDLVKGLTDNKAGILAALPAGLNANMFGLAADAPRVTTDTTTRRVDPTPAPKPNNNWLIWLLVLLALLALLWLLLGKGCSRTDDGTVVVTDSTTVVEETAIDAGQTIRGALNDAGDWVYDVGANIKRTLKDGFEIEVGEYSTENRLITFIEDPNVAVDKETWFSFDRLYFETGSATLKPESQNQLKRIASIMASYPNVNLKVGGYTDSSGDEAMNMKLSQDRANAAKQALVDLGVAANRLEAEGYGSQHPVCPANDTPECKAQNRRIDVRVTAK